jgi:hypothetical protein
VTKGWKTFLYIVIMYSYCLPQSLLICKFSCEINFIKTLIFLLEFFSLNFYLFIIKKVYCGVQGLKKN